MNGLKNNKKLLIIVGLICVIFSGYYLVKTKNNKSDGMLNNEKLLISIKKDEVKNIEYIDKANSLIVKSKNGTWVINDNSDTQDVDKIINTIDKLLNLEYSRVAEEDAKDLEKYGVNNPEKMIKVNNKIEINIGNTLSEESEVYVSTNKNSNVYILSTFDLNEAFLSKDEAFPPEFPASNIDSNSITKVIMNYDDGVVIEANKKNENWQLDGTEYTGLKADNYRIDNILNYFKDLRYEEVIDKNDDNMKKYGLDKPTNEVKIYANEKEYVMYIGTLGENNTAILFKDDNSIYTVSTQKIKNDLFNYGKIVSENILYLDNSNIKNIIISGSEIEDNCEIEFNHSNEDNGIKYKKDGIDITEDDISDLLYSINAVLAVNRISDKEELGDIKVSIDIEGELNISAKFYEYEKDNNYYYTVVNGVEGFLVEKTSITAVQDSLVK